MTDDTNDAAPPQPPAPAGPPHEAERLLEQGVERFEAGDLETAHALFERAHRKSANDARVMSWYGVTLVMVERNSNLGVLYCDQSMRSSGPTPELLLNQARAHLALNQRERAVRAIQRGISSWPDHAGLKLAQDAMGWRRKPVFPCFSRANPLNRWLGRLRHRWYQHRSPPPALSAATLGLTAGPGEPQGE